MITATARASVKSRLDIDSSNTQFDTVIDEFVLSGVNRLYPIAQKEVDIQSKIAGSDNFGEASMDLSTLPIPAIAARKVEYSTNGDSYSPAPDTYHHGTVLVVRDLPANQSLNFKIYGLTVFTLANVPVFLEQAVIWYAMSEFFDYMASAKKDYNIYMESGARDVDNMRDQSEYYEQKANVFLNDRAQLYGLS